MSPRPVPAALALVLVVGMLGACTARSSGRGASSTPSPTTGSAAVTGVVPGHGTPASALAGWVDGAVAGRAGAACNYALPSQQTACPGVTYVLGTQALVALLGTICTDGDCRSNSDRRLGLPADDAGFATAYQTAVSTDILTDACQKVGGLWYVDLGSVPTNQPV